MNKLTILFFLLLLTKTTIAQNNQQTSFTIHINPTFASKILVVDEEEEPPLKADTIIIETLRFYLSKIRLYQNTQEVWAATNSYHLVDVAEDKSLLIPLDIPSNLQFDRVQLQLGIDSLTNVAGVMGGDLDPTKGMYWSWNTGYINFKLEGRSLSCPTRFNAFQFHLGGYRSPHNTLQTLQFPVDNKQQLKLTIDIAELLSTIDLTKQHTIMSPSEAAKKMSILTANLFKHETSK